jgi:hypothetical protein
MLIKPVDTRIAVTAADAFDKGLELVWAALNFDEDIAIVEIEDVAGQPIAWAVVLTK